LKQSVAELNLEALQAYN